VTLRSHIAACFRKWRTPIALCVTTTWLALAVWWTFYRPCGAWEVPTLALNGWGDWAAGTFAPLAFLWLVLGYFQQGEELRLQARELRNSVDQQKDLASSNKLQAQQLETSHRLAVHAHVADYQPEFSNFRFDALLPENGLLRLTMENRGAPARDVLVRANVPPGTPSTTFRQEHWTANSAIAVTVATVPQDAQEVELQIDYKDPLLVAQTQWFRVFLQGNKSPGNPLPADLIGVTARLPPLRN
jgi:hypothetical protein